MAAQFSCARWPRGARRFSASCPFSSSRRSSPSIFWWTGTRWSQRSTVGCRSIIATSLRSIAAEINAALAGFIRGQSLVCLFLGLWYGIGLTLIGHDFGFLIGVIAGVLSFIPYVGSLTALVLSLGVGLVQGWPSLTLFFSALGVVLVGQFLEGNVVSPKLVGGSIGLHPVWLMFALFAFGELFGFTGLLIAVPTAAAIGVIARHLIGLYLNSPLYRGDAAATLDPNAQSLS